MPIDPTRRHELAAFYATHHQRLRRTVARRAHGLDDATIEDACQTAWTILMRRPDIPLNAGGISWLQTVATREAWVIAGRSRAEIPSGAFLPGGADPELAGELPEPPADQPAVDDQVIARLEHQERRAALAQLPLRDRRTLWLQGAGYSYAEIGQLTGATYTAVNRRITEGRAALRRAA